MFLLFIYIDIIFTGTSTLALATAMGKPLFESIYYAHPEAVTKTSLDDVSPMCVAAMLNDKDSFMKLQELGIDPSIASKIS